MSILKPTPQFRVGDTNMLVSKNAKICVTPNAKSKICVTLNANLQRKPVVYTIDCVGSPGVGAPVGHVHFMLFTSCYLVFGTQHNPVSSEIQALILNTA